MDKYAAGTRASDLTLVEIAKPREDPHLGAEAAPSVPGGADSDKFLTEAIREFQAGRVDRPLWTRALSQAGGDEKLAKPAYLRARATALRVAKRDERTGKTPRRARSRDDATRSTTATRGVLTPANRKYLIWGAGALTGILLVVAGMVAMRDQNATQQPALTAQAPVPSPTAAEKNDPASNPAKDFVGRMQALKDAGNWNVLVLYAVEWTRAQPENPVAWKELSAGYLKLRQLEEALGAANKAVELAPMDAAMWRNLGQVDMAINDLAAAALAFERASTLNDQDIASLVQLGMLNLRFGRVQPAKAAFAKALAVRPDDVDVLCGSASVARQEGRVKDAEAITGQINASGRNCRDWNSTESSAVVAMPPANGKTVVIPRR